MNETLPSLHGLCTEHALIYCLRFAYKGSSIYEKLICSATEKSTKSQVWLLFCTGEMPCFSSLLVGIFCAHAICDQHN